MAFNFANLGQQTLESLLPMFQSMANGVVIPTPPNFPNHLGRIANSSLNNNNKSTSHSTSETQNTKSIQNPELSTTPRLSVNPLLSNVKANKGTIPMDLDNDFDVDQTCTTSASIINSTTATISATTTTTTPITKPNNNMIMNMSETQLYLNELMANNIAMNSGLLYFPSTSTSTNNATTASGNVMQQLDATDMMAVAMQQVQSNFMYSMPEVSTADKTSVISDTIDDSNRSKTTAKVKEIIKTKNCILLPPNPHAPPPTLRDKPPGCRTVFVGGLPENITEEIIREIFDSCGEITTLRMSKKNFCHIRFRSEDSIDLAIYLSGYRIRLGTTNEATNYGRLHVDYAQARDDQYDYECRQRQLQREQRHRERRSHDRSNTESPPPLPHYSDHEASIAADHLRSDETFVKAMQTITVWLERGDCNKRNANVFYSMIQSTHSHVRRLISDKQLFEEDLRKAREIYRKQMLTMSTRFTQIEKMFNAASHKKVWDHFTKAQRKNIDQWKKLATELRSIQMDDVEMEISDDDYHGRVHVQRLGHNHNHSQSYNARSIKRKRYESDHLKEENDSLRCQLEAIRNEMSLERTDLRYSSEFREKQIKVLQETIRNMQTQLLQTKIREQKDNKTIEQLERRLKEAAVKQLLLKTRIRETVEKLKDREQITTATTGIPRVTCIYDLENDSSEIIDIDVDKSDDEVKIIDESRHLEHRTEYTVSRETEPLNQKKNANANVNTNESIQSNEIHEVTAATSTSVDTLSNEISPIKDTTNIELKEKLPTVDAKLLALSAAYLIIQPFGCTTATLCTYIKQVTDYSCIQSKQLNSLLKKYQSLFQSDKRSNDSKHNDNNNDDNSSFKDDSILWKFCGFKSTTIETEALAITTTESS